MDLGSVDWAALGAQVGAVVAGAAAAFAAASRVWKKGLGDLLRPVVQSETRKAMRGLAADVNNLRASHSETAEAIDDLQERVARVEGHVNALSQNRNN